MSSRTLAAALVFSLIAGAARADDRAVDGVLGAGAGALTLGPVGLVAGGVIGYAGGPRISCRLRGGCPHRRRLRRRHT